MSNTTSTREISLGQIMECPLTGEKWLANEEDVAWAKQQEQVRQRLVAEFSSAPLYQARAAKDPEYWNTFSIGRVR
jgi:hypothetical protein